MQGLALAPTAIRWNHVPTGIAFVFLSSCTVTVECWTLDVNLHLLYLTRRRLTIWPCLNLNLTGKLRVSSVLICGNECILCLNSGPHSLSFPHTRQIPLLIAIFLRPVRDMSDRSSSTLQPLFEAAMLDYETQTVVMKLIEHSR